MSEIHPHDALLARLNEEQFQSRKLHGMWGGCDWLFIDADPEALVIEVVAKKEPHRFARSIAADQLTAYRSQFRTGVIRTWSRLSGSDEEPLLQEFPFVFEEDPSAYRQRSADLWETCAAIAWERGTKAKARPEAGEIHRVVNVVSAAPPLPKPHEEMSKDEVQAWAGAWAEQIIASIVAQQGEGR